MYNRLILIQSFLKPSIAVILDSNEIYSVLLDVEGSEVGNIYKGRVTAIQKGINACFVSLGQGKSGFLNLADVPPIVEIKPNSFIMVKIKKDQVKGKDPQLSAQITLAGKYTILLPFENSIKVSNRIEEKDTQEILVHKIYHIREKLSQKYSEIKNIGFIARTNSKYCDAIQMLKDIENLYQTWQKILEDYNKSNYEKLLYKDESFAIRVIREFFDSKTKVIVDNKDDYLYIKNYLSFFEPEYVNCVDYFDPLKAKKNLLEFYNVRIDLNDFIKTKINLPIGGYLSIQHTELGTTIDINSGSYMEQTPQETYKNYNLKAIKEIIRQIRLRDISGIILIDFLKIHDEIEKQKMYTKIIEEIEKNLKEDKKKVKIWDFTKLGILEITRERTEEENYNKISTPCKYCQGSGYTLSPKYQAYQIINSINSYIVKLVSSREKNLYVEISVDILPFFLEEYVYNNYDKFLHDYGFKLAVRTFKHSYYLPRQSKYKIKALQNFSSFDSSIEMDFPKVGDILELEAWYLRETHSNIVFSVYKRFPIIIQHEIEPISEGVKNIKVEIKKVIPFYYIEGYKIEGG
ncbi:MAG: ribonuclease E/G [bacterium]